MMLQTNISQKQDYFLWKALIESGKEKREGRMKENQIEREGEEGGEGRNYRQSHRKSEKGELKIK